MAAACNTTGVFQSGRLGQYYRQARTHEHFPDPFCDMASLAMPTSNQEALLWAEYLLNANGPYRQALDRVASYFITDVEIVSVSRNRLGVEEKKKYLDFLNDTLGIRDILKRVALDFMVYGNSFTSVTIPFRRYLTCPGCNLELPLKRIFNTAEFGFRWSNFQFHASCPHCKYSGAWKHVDRRTGDRSKISVCRWSPHEMDIVHEKVSNDRGYFWKIPEDYRQDIKNGSLFHLERAGWNVIQAIKDNQHMQFDDDIIHHMVDEPFSGQNMHGWGQSRVLTNFRQAWLLQILQRYNEAFCLDYIVPFRTITPMPRPGQGGEVNDPVLTMGMGTFVNRVQKMLAAHRRDPAGWHVLPFPIEYKALGGEATQLMPKELIELALSTLLDAAGVPAELYKGSLSVQSAPVALRLFEANWSHLVHNLNRFLMELVNKVSQLMLWEPVVARLVRVRHADDLNRQMAKLQMMVGGQVSKTTGLETMGLEHGEEEQRKVDEAKLEAEIQSEAQKELEQAAIADEMVAPGGAASPAGGAAPTGAPPAPVVAPPQGGAPATGGGMPPPGAPGPMGMPGGPYGAVYAFMSGQPLLGQKPRTLDEVMNIATVLAQQIQMQPESIKDSMLIQLSHEDEVVHQLVKSQLAKIKRDAERRGGAMVMQQEYGKQASVPATPPPTPAIPPQSASSLYASATRVRRRILDL